MAEIHPWELHKQLGYGVTLDSSHPGRTKQYKVRLRVRTQVLNVGRWARGDTAEQGGPGHSMALQLLT
jgi:hypothetical protein